MIALMDFATNEEFGLDFLKKFFNRELDSIVINHLTFGKVVYTLSVTDDLYKIVCNTFETNEVVGVHVLKDVIISDIITYVDGKIKANDMIEQTLTSALQVISDINASSGREK